MHIAQYAAWCTLYSVHTHSGIISHHLIYDLQDTTFWKTSFRLISFKNEFFF